MTEAAGTTGWPRRYTRRHALTLALGGMAVGLAGGAAAAELVSHGVLPGKTWLDTVDGACAAPGAALEFSPLGPSVSGSFASQARRRQVGYTIGYPPGHAPGDPLSLVVMLHGFGGSHEDALVGMSPAGAVALKVDGEPLPPVALVTVDGGNGYWTPHPGDDPMAMVVDELVPLCQRLGLGRPPHRVGTMGISMGGYGALLFGEKFPSVFVAVAAISPAIWTSYGQAHAANPGAYASAAAFDANDVVTHTSTLHGRPVRVAAGDDDPFLPGVQALARSLPSGALTYLGAGCHTSPFFLQQEPLSMAFLAQHLV